MKAGSHLGALGALINNIENFIKKDGSIAPTKPDEAKENGTEEAEK